MVINKKSVYRSWLALAIFVIILIFQPTRATFYAIRPSDIWLLICLFLQIKNGYITFIPIRNSFIVRNYGLLMGVLAIIATLIQASYANLSLNISVVFHFFRFLRFLLIFKFIENIVFDLSRENVRKFWNTFTVLGLAIIILSFFEYYDIQPFKPIIMNQYYDVPESTFESSLIQLERLVGVMGNANATAIFLVCTLPYPLLRIGTEGTHILRKIFYIAYIFAVVYVLIVMSGSRTAIFVSLLVFIIFVISSVRRFKDLLLVILLTCLLTATGVYLYQRFKSEIIIQDRVTESFRGMDFQFTVKGVGEWANRYEMWHDRFNTFKSEGNQLSILLGLGYTGAYQDYSDNGLVSALVNNGIMGLILKLFLFYIFIRFGLLSSISHYRRLEIEYSYLVFAICTFALLLWEFTADLTEHYKLGQLFYMFLSITLITNSKMLSTKIQQGS